MARIDFVGTNRKPALFRGDASFVYRCENLAGALRAAGHRAEMSHIADYAPAGADAVVVHRPQLSARFLWLAHVLRRAGTRVIVDLDDLIFDPATAAHSPAVVNGILPLWKIWLRFVRHRRALDFVDAVVCSTDAIADRLRRLVPELPVAVVPNAVHVTWRAHDDEPVSPDERTKVVTYTSGTRSHDRDFRLVTPVLERFLEAHPEVTLRITGHLEHSLSARPGQVSQSPRAPFSEYAAIVRAGWVNLCPLEPSPFNECKSAIKVIEAGYFHIPTVTSPNPDIERFAAAGAIVATHPEDFGDALERLLDPREYEAVTRALRARVLALADVHEQARALLGFAGLGDG